MTRSSCRIARWVLLVAALGLASVALGQAAGELAEPAPAAPLVAAAPTPAPAEPAGDHGDPVGPILLRLVVILLAAKLAASIFLKRGQPAVLGELVAGVVLANVLLLAGHTPETAAQADGVVGWWGRFVTETLAPGTPMDILARIGVVLLLFMVGLESNLAAMMKVGVASFLVATIGVVAPFVLGLFVSQWLLPGTHDPLVHVFIGATLTATSVGITARVFQELGRLDQDEARVVLGAAVIDDVMGLVILAAVTGVIGARATGESLSVLAIVRIVVMSVGFLVAALVGGQWLAPRAFALTSRLRGEGVLLITALVLCFGLAGLAGLVGLAPIVGAFAAGLLLDEVHYVDFNRPDGADQRVEDLLRPVAELLVPVFFVQMGMSVRLASFVNPQVLGFAAALTLAAVLGKQVCGLVVSRRLDRVSIGIGMVPRGEVGLIFAAIGRQLRIGGEPVISEVANSAVVLMVIVTTMITPGLLQWSLRRGEARRAGAAAATPDSS